MNRKTNIWHHFSFQSSQVVLDEMGQSLHFIVPAFAPGNGSVATKGSPQSQLQLEFALPLSKVRKCCDKEQSWADPSGVYHCSEVNMTNSSRYILLHLFLHYISLFS